MSPRSFSDAKEIRARAWLLGSRVDVRRFERSKALALAPLTVPAGEEGLAFVFRFGAVVLVRVTPAEEAAFLAELAPLAADPHPDPEHEEAEIRVAPEEREQIDPSGTLVLREASLERLQVVAEILAKSTALAFYEEQVARVFDEVENLASTLGGSGLRKAARRDLLRQIGSVLHIQTRTVGRVEVTEKPEITWDRPELDRLYERLAVEYELRDRDVALARKLEVISQTAETYQELLQHRQTLRVEWYIVILILVEIVIILWEMVLDR